MSTERKIPAEEKEVEFFVSNSKFISSLKPTFSVDEAKSFIKEIEEKYADATHNVPVYIIGHPPAVVEHCSDDGEPSGTAGKPALAVLRGSGLGDVTIVITRYFGGTKLGKGGLVRAYSDSVRTILDSIKLATKIETIITEFQIPYQHFEQAQRYAQQFSGQFINQTFEAEVTLEIQFRPTDFEAFKNAIVELSRGQITPEIRSKNANTIFPID